MNSDIYAVSAGWKGITMLAAGRRSFGSALRAHFI
jgi:hypothetical protein